MEYYKESKNPSKLHTDRYKNCKILTDIDTGEVLLATREIVEIPMRSNDTYHRVKSNEVGRLDIIANNYYRNSLLWWVLAQANDIYNPIDSMYAGMIIRIPPIESLYGNKGILL